MYKAPSNCHHQQTNTHLFTGLMPSSHPTNNVKALKGKYLSITSFDLCKADHLLNVTTFTTKQANFKAKSKRVVIFHNVKAAETSVR